MMENLTPRQRKAIENLLTTGNIREAADSAKVSRETIYKWMKAPAFRDALKEGSREALERLSRALMSLGDKAVKALEDALDDPESKASAKVRPADVILGRLLQLKELADLEERISALEAAQTEKRSA